jgi:hypothetical protein
MGPLVGKLSRHRPMLGNRKRTLATVAIGAAVAASALFVISELRTRNAGARDMSGCDRTLAGWESLWNPTRQDALAKAAGTAADDALPALRSRMDAWVGSWRSATHNFCSQPGGRAEASECTARAHAVASDLLALVQSGGAARFARAAAAAEALPTSEQCASSDPSPASAPLAVVKADVRRRLGMLDEANQLNGRAPDDAGQRSYHHLVGGYTAADRGDLIDARRMFESATFDAQAARQPELAVTAAIQRLALSCSAAERVLWNGYLGAQMLLGSYAFAQVEYRSALAESLLCEGKIAEAVALRRQVEQALHSDASSVGAGAALDLARAQLSQRDLAGAELVARRAATLYGQLYGPRHPLALTAELTVAEAELQSPASSAAAASAIERVLATLGDRKEPDAVRARALMLQGRLAEARGERDEALHKIQRAAQEYEAALGGAHPDLAGALLIAGDLLLDAGKNQEAEANYRQVAAIFDTLGQSDSARLAHARAGIQLARWGNRPPPDADDTLHWGLAPTGDAIDPAVAGWLAEQLGRRAAARGDQAAALAQYRAAAVAWRQSGDQRGLASAVTQSALLAAELHDPDARALLEEALQITASATVVDKPRMQGALAKLLWPAQRDRAKALMRAALADLPDSSADAIDLKYWLKRHEADR